VGDQSGVIHLWDLKTDHNEQLVSSYVDNVSILPKEFTVLTKNIVVVIHMYIHTYIHSHTHTHLHAHAHAVSLSLSSRPVAVNQYVHSLLGTTQENLCLCKHM
jgi:hypothetical protein